MAGFRLSKEWWSELQYELRAIFVILFARWTTIAEVALAALEFVTVNSEMTQSIIEVLMGDKAPPMQMGDAPETILARVVDTVHGMD